MAYEERPEIVEVEVESSTVDEVKVNEGPTRVKDDYSRQIRFFGRLSSAFLGVSGPMFFIGIVVGLIFAILNNDYNNMANVVLFSIGFSIAGLGVIGAILGFAFRGIMRAYKKKDPNFEDKIHSDEVYE